MRILSYNVCLSVCPPLRFNGAFSRALHVAESLNEVVKSLDVICFQELVVSREEVLAQFIHHPFKTNIAGSSFFSDNIRFLHSGLAIVSRWPILEQDHHIFTGATYHMEAFMAKAVQYARIHLENKYLIHVFNTHTQAWINEKSDQIRKSQFEQILTFMKSKNIPPSEPVLLVGDFNLDFYEHSHLINELLDKMKFKNVASDFLLSAAFSFDPTRNPLVGTDDAKEYATLSYENGCYEEYLNNHICPCCPKQLIDFVCLNEETNLLPESKIEVLDNRLEKDIWIFVNVSYQRSIPYVSDHFPVLATLLFDSLSPCEILTEERQKKKSSTFSIQWVLVEVVIFIIVYVVLFKLLLLSRNQITAAEKD
jgi:endonuclease/exonuclease/phosphatase family metal-dependent hydrolase